MRRLFIIGEINEESFKDFSTELSKLEEESIKPVVVELHSDGGNPFVGLAFSSRIRTSVCRIHIEAHGVVGSSATIILAAGDQRAMAKESWLYLHEAEVEEKDFNEKASSLENLTKTLRMHENQWNQLLEFYTKTPKEKWDELHKKDVYIPADECVKLGIADRVF